MPKNMIATIHNFHKFSMVYGQEAALGVQENKFIFSFEIIFMIIHRRVTRPGQALPRPHHIK